MPPSTHYAASPVGVEASTSSRFTRPARPRLTSSPIGSGHPFWETIKYSHASRMVVAEFKNHHQPVGQTEVESLQQYLLPRTRRPYLQSQPIQARRRAWMTPENIILFLSDGDLADLVRLKSREEDPTEVLDAQTDDFFITLAP